MADLHRSDVSGRPVTQAGAAGPTTQASPRRKGGGYSTVVEDGFSGWNWFAGGLLGLVGLFQIMTGTVALAGVDYYTVPARSLVLDASYASWGWTHLIIGILALVAGGGVVFGNMIARVVGIALAVLSAVVNLAFLPASPFGATLIIALDVFVIYAITVHGGDINEAQ
jgi:hypothetical protein